MSSTLCETCDKDSRYMAAKAENAKLREKIKALTELASIGKLTASQCTELAEDNARMRELVQEAVDAASLKDMRDWRYGKRLAFLREARELGIEMTT